MSHLSHFIPIIEAKSGAPPLQFASDTLRELLGFDPEEMRRSGYDPSTIELDEQYYKQLESCMEHPLIGEYLTTLTPLESYETSGVWVATLQQIRKCTFSRGWPDSQLFPHGYIPIAGDGGGNSVSFHSPSGRVVFAHHEQTDKIIAGNILVLSEDITSFLDDLLHDRLTERLEELD